MAADSDTEMAGASRPEVPLAQIIQSPSSIRQYTDTSGSPAGNFTVPGCVRETPGNTLFPRALVTVEPSAGTQDS